MKYLKSKKTKNDRYITNCTQCSYWEDLSELDGGFCDKESWWYGRTSSPFPDWCTLEDRFISAYELIWDSLFPRTLEKEKDMKYKATGKILQGIGIVNTIDSSLEEKERFVKKYGLYPYIEINTNFMKYAFKHDCFKEWLIKNKYIEEIPEKTYKIGDVFIGKISKIEYAICSISNNKICLIGNSRSLSYDLVLVKDVYRITKEELCNISTKFFENYTLKEEIKVCGNWIDHQVCSECSQSKLCRDSELNLKDPTPCGYPSFLDGSACKTCNVLEECEKLWEETGNRGHK